MKIDIVVDADLRFQLERSETTDLPLALTFRPRVERSGLKRKKRGPSPRESQQQYPEQAPLGVQQKIDIILAKLSHDSCDVVEGKWSAFLVPPIPLLLFILPLLAITPRISTI
jgi:hypothetical protein